MPRKVQANPTAVVIYARVSTQEQGKSGLGVEAQLASCQRLIEQEGLVCLGSYKEVVSGKVAPSERPVFAEAIKLAQSTGARLMIAKLDRLSREVYHVSQYLHNPKSPKLIVCDRPNASEFELNIIASLAQEERRLISERTKAALAARKEQGKVNGTVAREVSTMRARVATQEAIDRAKQLKLEGKGLTEITRLLNQEGFKTSRGSNWSKQALSERLKAA